MGELFGAGVSMLAALGAAVALAAPASADTESYIRTLESAGLIDHDSDPCNMIDGACHGQFPNSAAALRTGTWVCDQVRYEGRSEASLVDWLSHGEGLMPSSYNAPIIVDAATTYLCP
ncbi:DUF732 domain-containing protein [Mycobacterium sp. 29Ha]|uniref:DUF732 domain-containing protein n=1 Tax=Mycobacterium sp. 29Ha TaxID=2939268 RepID=UPI002938E442|nr:DUF732 domain-containing protein [Mycobacterium sp. 29Ha]MDV3135331.1 DUF732 domain-containing protein [Mycobacterium sp. 29Ha]